MERLIVLRVGLGQLNASVGDLDGNVESMRKVYAEAVRGGVDLLVFGEMAVCGYPPEDLLLKKHFLQDNHRALEALAVNCREGTVVVGFAEAADGKCYNSLAVLKDGRVGEIYRKCRLVNYGVFDEQRYFQSGNKPVVINVNGVSIVLSICEDMWQLDWLDDFLKDVPGRDVMLNSSASPFHMGKTAQRLEVLSQCAKRFGWAVGYCNLVGGQDELVFDGRSMFLDSAGRVVCQADAFREDLLIAEIDVSGKKGVQVKSLSSKQKTAVRTRTGSIGEVYEALVLGTTDYARKNGFTKALIGLSGGIDSSVTAAIAVAALGPENVIGVTMPSRFNSSDAVNDAEQLAGNLAVEFHTIPIEQILETFNKTLSSVHGWDSDGVAYENLQARIRGGILMSLSNQFGCLVLTTGNKSETAVGYCTLYGDTAGGFAVIKDVPKTMVYELAEYINKINQREIIPASVISRVPSAELRPGQKDSDSLGDYELLDRILKGYVEEDKSAQQLAEAGLSQDLVNRIIRMVDRNEYKRRQSPPGVKITPKAFGKDRRLPITNCYSSQA